MDHEQPFLSTSSTLISSDSAQSSTSRSSSHSEQLSSPIITAPKSSNFHRRSHSAPSLLASIKQESSMDSIDRIPHPEWTTTSMSIRQALIAVLLYLIAGIVMYLIASGNSFRGVSTFEPVDAVYFVVVTLSTIGYGDIVPDTTFTKLFTCGFILVGFGFIDILLNGLVIYICDRQEAVLLNTVDQNRFNTYMIDKEKGRMRIRIKVGLALGVVIGCIAIGTVMSHFLEDLNWIDSFYLSVISVTSVGYGDYSFTTLTGRCFAIIWLLVSTLAVTRAFLYLTELRIDKRNRRFTEWLMKRKMTMGDFVAADLDHDGWISKSEFVVYKLKEMGKIAEKDILQIARQFDSIDHSNHGKITLAHLIERKFMI